MSFDVIYSDWLSSTFDNVVATKEWNVFLADLHDAVDHQLAENNIDNFHNLLDHEKSIILSKAIQSLNGNVCYQIIQERLSQILDIKVNNEAERIIRIDINPFQTRTEAILTATFEGIISILDRWPDLKSKLTKLFNQHFPGHLRHYVWKAILDNPEVLKTYQRDVRSKSKTIISKYDKEISRNCENILNNEPIFIEMKGSVGCFYAMKAILSYYQASNMGEVKLPKNDYLLVAPFVYVLHTKLSLREPPTIKVMEILVQEYFTLRQIIAVDLPFIYSTDQVDQVQYRYFCQQVYKNIVSIDVGSAQSLMDHIIPAQDNIVATEIKLFDLGGEIIEKLLRQPVTSLFVGYLSMETLLFVWDQYLLGLDKPIFRERYWPMITAIYLELIVRRRIISRNNSVTASLNEEMLKNEGPKLKPFDFQYQINKSFYIEMMRVINKSNVSGIDPITEPTKWKHWFDSIHHVIPISPDNRNEIRILRQNEREKLFDLQAQLDLAAQEKERIEKNLEIQAQAYVTNYEKSMSKYKSDNVKLRTELDNSLMENEEANKTIERLQIEIEKLKEMGLRHSELVDYRGLVPPPGSLMSRGTSRQNSQSNYEFDPLAKFAQDYISQLADSFQIILNGEGKDKYNLNGETIKALQNYESYKREAEMQIFKRYLSPNELESLDASNDGYYSQKLNQEIAKIADERRKNARPPVAVNTVF